MNVEQEVDVLKRQMQHQREHTHRLDDWMDTVNSPWIKRLWWWVLGYRYHRLGRWYGRRVDGD